MPQRTTTIGGTLGAILFPALAHAQTALIPTTNPAGCDFLTGVHSSECIPNYIAYLIKFIFSFTGAICLIMILIAGYQVALAKVTGADRSAGMQRMRMAVIGLIVSACAWYIIDFIVSTLAGI